REPAQQRRLAGPVGPDDRQPLAVGHRQVDVVEHARAAEGDGHTRCLDHAVTPRREVRSTSTKNGAPKKAVTTPIGISAGDAMVRPSRSASTRHAPPNSLDSGSTTR